MITVNSKQSFYFFYSISRGDAIGNGGRDETGNVTTPVRRRSEGRYQQCLVDVSKITFLLALGDLLNTRQGLKK